MNQLRTFLGLANYYIRFIPHLSSHLEPLNSKGKCTDEKFNPIIKKLRRTIQQTTGFIPYEVMFGRKIRTELDLLKEDGYTNFCKTSESITININKLLLLT